VALAGAVAREPLIPPAALCVKLSGGSTQDGEKHVALEIDEGVTFREIMAEAGKAVTDAVVRKHGNCVNDAMRDLGISKDIWYRVRRD
jgi:hypothetical protein